MDLTLIPFATRLADGALVAVDEVPSGKRCWCVCPSCQSPLVARRGTQKVWHFAHTARADGADTEVACEFSWAVCVRLMARQLLPTLEAFRLPPAVFPIFVDGLERRPPVPTFDLGAPAFVPLSDWQVDTLVEGVSVDAAAAQADDLWVIYLSHRGRPVPNTLASLPKPTLFVVSVDLDAFLGYLRVNPPASGHRLALQRFLADDISAKAWVLHPGEAAGRARAREDRFSEENMRPPRAWERDMIERRRQKYPSLLSGARHSPPESRFHCHACDHRFTSSLKVPACPHCGGSYSAWPGP